MEVLSNLDQLVVVLDVHLGIEHLHRLLKVVLDQSVYSRQGNMMEHKNALVCWFATVKVDAGVQGMFDLLDIPSWYFRRASAIKYNHSNPSSKKMSQILNSVRYGTTPAE